MDTVEVVALLQDLETDRVERKESLSDPDRVCQAICAFANDLPDHRRPGVIGIGIDDAGKAVGLEVTDDLLLRLAQMRDTGGIYPFPSMTVSRVMIDGSQVAVVVVQPPASWTFRVQSSTPTAWGWSSTTTVSSRWDRRLAAPSSSFALLTGR